MDGIARDPNLLAGAFYEAALEPQLWTRALDNLGDALRGAGLVVGFHRPEGLAFYAANRLDPDRSALLHDHYASPKNNPFLAAMPRLPLLTAVDRSSIMDDREYLRSSIYNEVFHPQRLLHAATACLARGSGFRITGGVFRRATGQFGSEEADLYQAILPHVRRAIELTMRMHDLRMAERRAQAAADLNSDGLIIVDQHRRITFTNAAAEAILRSEGGVYRHGGVLDARRRDDAACLARLVREAALRIGSCGGCLRIANGEEKAPTALIMTPFPADLANLNAPSASALVALVDLGATSAPQARHLRALFGLSKAEAELALALLEGKHAEDIARERDVRLSTVRSQLRAILEKTGARRQAEAVRLLSRAPAFGNADVGSNESLP